MRMRVSSLQLNSARDLLFEELRDLYSAENQLIEALPKMAEAAGSFELKAAFAMHLNQTRQHAARLEKVFQQLGEQAQGETSGAMKELIQEEQDLVNAQGEKDVIDAGLLGAAQRVEHYEIACYGTARALARQMGKHQIAEMLQQTLDEEEGADKQLTQIAESYVNPRAASHG
jgi:ferritin-like metal-binding protein YciE